jgi:hypothetical protein
MMQLGRELGVWELPCPSFSAKFVLSTTARPYNVRVLRLQKGFGGRGSGEVRVGPTGREGR